MVFAVDGLEREGERLAGQGVVLLGQGVDAEGEKVEQAIVTEGGHGEPAHVGLLLQQVVQHPLHQYVGGGDQRLGQLTEPQVQLLDQPIALDTGEVLPLADVGRQL
ncbi:hypothetical protein D3C78_1610260 [compost metagenome]